MSTKQISNGTLFREIDELRNKLKEEKNYLDAMYTFVSKLDSSIVAEFENSQKSCSLSSDYEGEQMAPICAVSDLRSINSISYYNTEKIKTILTFLEKLI